MEVVGGCCYSGNIHTFNHGMLESKLDWYVNVSKVSVWRLLWRKIKKEKRKIFDCSSMVQFTYDPYTYAQNFDDGVTWIDADDLSRTFSARFAVPSRVFEETAKELMDQ